MKNLFLRHIRLIRYVLFFIGIFLLTVSFYILILKDLPSPTRLSSSKIPQSTQIFDRNDKLLYTIHGSKNQTFVPLNQIPKHLHQATIAIEDKDFYRHGAIDFRGIARAFVATVFYKDLQGGSTLTQQLVKTSLLTPERTVTRKIKEVLLSFGTELLYSKDKILEMYLNQVPYGGTAYGAEAAARSYFGKHVTDLTLAESALLAGLPEAPSVYSPFGSRPELARMRQEEVLNNMEQEGFITKEEKEEALKQELKFEQFVTTIQAPHFVLYVKDLLEKKYGVERIEQGGLRVKTTLDLAIQDFTQNAVATEVAKLRGNHVTNGAALVTNPATGEVLAMVGSKNYFDTDIDGNVNVTLSMRQPGSSIKPISYATGLIKGYSPATPFVDQKICFPNPGKAPYCPVNYDGKFRGVIQMRSALGSSINIPAVKMLKLTTVESMIATASAMGITSFKDPQRYGLSLSLGGGEVTMLEMATAYGVFANGGYRIDLHPILKVTDTNGEVIDEYTPPTSPIFGKRVFSSAVSYIISHILSDNGARSLAFGTNSQLVIPKKDVAVKTGTTNDYRDNWTIGYTPSTLVAVWVGNNDNTPMGNLTSGVTGAAPIWNTVMTHLLQERSAGKQKQPDSVIGKHVCSTSGLLPPAEGTPDRCPTHFEYFIKGTEPKRVDPGRQKVLIDKATNDLAKSGQTDNVEERMEIVVTDATGDRYCLSCPHPAEPTPTKTP